MKLFIYFYPYKGEDVFYAQYVMYTKLSADDSCVFIMKTVDIDVRFVCALRQGTCSCNTNTPWID